MFISFFLALKAGLQVRVLSE